MIETLGLDGRRMLGGEKMKDKSVFAKKWSSIVAPFCYSIIFMMSLPCFWLLATVIHNMSEESIDCNHV